MGFSSDLKQRIWNIKWRGKRQTISASRISLLRHLNQTKAEFENI